MRTRVLLLLAGELFLIKPQVGAEDTLHASSRYNVTAAQSPITYQKLKDIQHAQKLVEQDSQFIHEPGRIPHAVQYHWASPHQKQNQPILQEGLWYVLDAVNAYPLEVPSVGCVARFQVNRLETPPTLLCEAGVQKAVRIRYLTGESPLFGVTTTQIKPAPEELRHGGSDRHGVTEICLPMGEFTLEGRKEDYQSTPFKVAIEEVSHSLVTVILCPPSSTN